MTVLVDSCAPWLNDKARSVHSQYGEDGLIEAVFDRIGIENRWCFEVGASDGVGNSNTKQWRDAGWHAVLAERDPMLFAKLEGFRSDTVHPICAEVDSHGLEDSLAFHGAPRDLDLGVIDIDGQDYWLWTGMERFQPRVMLVEFSPYVCNSAFVPPVGANGKSGQCQAGVAAIRKLGETKGYVEVAKTYVNLLFVLESEL